MDEKLHEGMFMIYKKRGETPLQALEHFRERLIQEKSLGDGGGGNYIKDAPMTYAGRLDPLAQGKLLILVGEECKNKEHYLGLDKEYEVEMVFGIETDTYDALGIAQKKVVGMRQDSVNENKTIDVKRTLSKLIVHNTPKGHTFMQTYPAYSSRTVGGTQLHELARADTLPHATDMPQKEVTIYSLEIIGERKISAQNLKQIIIHDVSNVHGDFRQKEITDRWNEFLLSSLETSFLALTVRVRCSSGTYMRSLAHEAGKRAGTGAFALSIIRTQIFLT